MPAVSTSQQHFAGMSQTSEGRAALRRSGRKPMPLAVAKEFGHKPSGKKLPRVKRKET